MKKTLLAAALLASASVSAMQPDMDNKYASGSLHIVNYDVSGLDIGSGFGIGAAFGVPINAPGMSEQISLRPEVGFVYLGTGEGDEGSIDYEMSGYTMYAAGIAAFSLTEQFALHAKAGLSYTSLELSGSTSYLGFSIDTEVDDSEIGLTYGIGGEFALNEKITVTADYTHLGSVNDADASSLSAGVNYKF